MENDLLAKLKLIGKLKQSEKINVKKMYIQPDNLLSRISRSFIWVDDRENTLQFINTVVDKCFETIKNEQRSDPRMTNMITDLKMALEGIKNLKKTYANDIFYCCKIDVLIEETEIKIKMIEKNNTDHNVSFPALD